MPNDISLLGAMPENFPTLIFAVDIFLIVINAWVPPSIVKPPELPICDAVGSAKIVSIATAGVTAVADIPPVAIGLVFPLLPFWKSAALTACDTSAAFSALMAVAEGTDRLDMRDTASGATGMPGKEVGGIVIPVARTNAGARITETADKRISVRKFAFIKLELIP